jgi:ATP:corrinoid adenosyltransferase
MHTYLYTGGERAKAVRQLAIGMASLQQPTLVARFGTRDQGVLLASLGSVLPVEVVRVRLPGLDWPLSHTPADQVAVQAALASLIQMIASGDYRLVILDGIREVASCRLLDAAELQRLAQSASDDTQVAMT